MIHNMESRITVSGGGTLKEAAQNLNNEATPALHWRLSIPTSFPFQTGKSLRGPFLKNKKESNQYKIPHKVEGQNSLYVLWTILQLGHQKSKINK